MRLENSTSSDDKSDGASSEGSEKTKPKPVLIRQTIQPTEIMDRLNLNRVRRMQKLWQGNPKGGLKLEEFVKVILSELQHQENERFELIQGAIRLFEEIDINNDGIMEWEEFVQFI